MTIVAIIASTPFLGIFAQLDLSTPKKTALSFCKSIQDQRWSDAAKCVVNGSVSKAQQVIGSFPKGGAMKLELKDLTSETQAETATVTGSLYYSMTVPNQPKTTTAFYEKLEMRRTGSTWLIVGPPVASGSAPTSPLAGMAAMFANGKATGQSTNPPSGAAVPPATKTLMNLKQMAVATMIYAADYDDLLPRSDWQKSLQPYLKNLAIYKSPMATAAKPSPYTFNALLHGKSLAKVADPAKTVLIYEGKANVLVYQYNGKGAVAYCDGHAKLVSKQEAASLRWKP